MKIKMVEIRDDGTRIAALAIKTEGENESEKKFFYATGFGPNTVILIRPDDPLISYDPYGWDTVGRTMPAAHQYIQAHFEELPDNGAVIDVQAILGEKSNSADSEIWR